MFTGKERRNFTLLQGKGKKMSCLLTEQGAACGQKTVWMFWRKSVLLTSQED
jgi:hypothetical protein